VWHPPGRPLAHAGPISFPGGLPITLGGAVIGAIGVSGSTVEDDHAVAAAGLTGLTAPSLAAP